MSAVLHDVVAVIRKSEQGILSGQMKLSLTTQFTADLLRLPHILEARRHHRHAGPPVIGKRAEELRLEALLEDLQYLNSIADRVIALKVIHGDGTLQGTISLQPFRSLRYLELKKLPLHLLTGLANLRGQLECIVCCRSLQDLDLLLRKCGGDSSQGFPWSQLKTLICIDCDIEELGRALDLTPALQSLDLSRNAIRNCGDAFLRLEDLTTVNLSHNHVEKVPQFAPLLSHRLKVLVLRNNRLESIEGAEDLENLLELDLSDNCISEHRLLWPLQRLFRLTRLNLHGNPISHHSKHRTLTVQYLSPRVVSNSRFQLDGESLSKVEMSAVSELLSPVVRTPVIRSASPLSAPTPSLGSPSGGELTQSMGDCISTSGMSASGRKKPLRVRTVKLADQPEVSEENKAILPNEPFVGVLGTSTSSAFAIDIEERRLRFGEEWLKFQAAQETSSSIPITSSLTPEPLRLEFPEDDDDVPSNSQELTHTGDLNRIESVEQAEQTETDENESNPFLVQLQDDPDPNHALLITLGDKHLIERNASGVVIEMLEITSILRAEVAVDDSRAVTVYFDYLRKDRRRRRYVFESPEQAREFVELVLPMIDRKDDKVSCYQCLQCSEIFPEYQAETKVKYVPRGDFQHSGYSSSVGSASTKGVLAETVLCPFCSSEMLMQHKSPSSSASVTPEEESSPSPSSSIATSEHGVVIAPTRQRSSSVVVLNSEPSDMEETILASSIRSPIREMLSPDIGLMASPIDDVRGYEREDSSEETLFSVENVDTALQVLRSRFHRTEPGRVEWRYDDYGVVDHRLRLHIDMNVLTDASEKFALLAKAGFHSTKTNHLQQAVIVVSNLRVYINRLDEQTSLDPSSWLHGYESAFLSDLNLLHQVCEKECLRIGFADGSFWMLMFRDRVRCAAFSHQFEDLLTSNRVSFLLRETTDTDKLETWLATAPIAPDDDAESSSTLTMRTLCLLGKAPITVLCTNTHIVMVKEDYQRVLRTGESTVTYIDSKPISAISCLVAYQQDPSSVGVKFFDEDPDCINQWDFYFETVDGVALLAQAVRKPWETLIFHVPLNVELYP